MRNTRGRDRDGAAEAAGQDWGQWAIRYLFGKRAFLFIALALLLTGSLLACGGGGDDGRPTVPNEPATVLVATVEPTGEPATPAPTAIPPTPTPVPTPTPPAPLAAMVNGQYIFLADYERRVAQYEQALLAQGLDPASEDGQANLVQIRQEVLDSLIDYVLIEQGAAVRGVTLDDAEVEARIEEDIVAGGGQAAFDEWLQSTGQSRDDYKEMLRESLLSQRVLESVAGDVPDMIEQVHARHILVESEAQAREILTLLQGGADFVALARERSIDVATRDNGGDLGWFPRGLIAPELEVVAFSLQPGEVSDVVELGGQYHILQVVERDPARSLSPEAQVDLSFALFDRWLAEQRAAAVIERFVGE